MKELIGIMYKGVVFSTISLSACLSQCVSRIKLGMIPSAFQVSYEATHMVGPHRVDLPLSIVIHTIL